MREKMGTRKSDQRTKSRRVFRDVAYIVYALLGLIAWNVAYLQWGSYPMDAESTSSGAQVIGMMVLLWFGLPLFILLPTALVFSLALSRDLRLLMMLLFTLALLIWVMGSTVQWVSNPWPMTAYGTTSLLFALYWFCRARQAVVSR